MKYYRYFKKYRKNDGVHTNLIFFLGNIKFKFVQGLVFVDLFSKELS